MWLRQRSGGLKAGSPYRVTAQGYELVLPRPPNSPLHLFHFDTSVFCTRLLFKKRATSLPKCLSLIASSAVQLPSPTILRLCGDASIVYSPTVLPEFRLVRTTVTNHTLNCTATSIKPIGNAPA